MTDATLATERGFAARGARFVVGVDEVGRGALAGPVHVGAVLVDMQTASEIAGVRDSKLLSPKRRESLVPVIKAWCQDFALGSATNDEIDSIGIMGALALAAQRALEQFARIDAIMLDGTVNWLGPWPDVMVECAAGADRRDLTVAAASVIAKVERDAVMTDLHEQAPEYDWARNKGYGSPRHLETLRLHGPTRWHRRSWQLPTPDPAHT